MAGWRIVLLDKQRTLAPDIHVKRDGSRWGARFKLTEETGLAVYLQTAEGSLAKTLDALADSLTLWFNADLVTDLEELRLRILDHEEAHPNSYRGPW